MRCQDEACKVLARSQYSIGRDFLTTFNPISGAQSNTRTYNIAGTYCEPLSGPGSTLLIATYGGSLDRS